MGTPPQPDDPHSHAGATRRAAGVLFAGFAGLYLATRQQNLSTYHDAIAHVRSVLADVGPHPHHLLFRWMERAWLWSMGTLTAPPLVAAASAAALSALSAASLVTLVFLILHRRFALPPPSATLGAALVGFSYGHWLHATVINVYILPLALLLACLLLLTGGRAGVGTYVTVAVVHALAVLIHQAYVLFTPVVALAAWMEREEAATRARWFVAYAIVSGGSVIAAYAIVAFVVLGQRSLGDFSYWITTYAHDGYFKLPGVVELVKAAIGFTRAAFGALWVFAVPGATALFSQTFERGVQDEAYVVRDVPPALAIMYLTATLLGMLLMVGLLVATRRAAKDVWMHKTRAAALTAATFVIFTVFFVFWMPELLEFWIPPLTMFWLLWAAQTLRPGPHLRARMSAGAAIAVTLVLSNFIGGIRHLASPANDFFHACMEASAPVVERDAPVFVNSEYLDDYLEVFLGIKPRRMRVPGSHDNDEARLDPAHVAGTLSADAARRGSTVSAYLIGMSVPPAMLGGSAVPHSLVTTPCEVWRVEYHTHAPS